jgi:hypothetical protein
MSRPPLSDSSKTVTRRLRLTLELADNFSAHCKALGYTASARIRKLMARDMLMLARHRRLKR